eukprot:543401_1
MDEKEGSHAPTHSCTQNRRHKQRYSIIKYTQFMICVCTRDAQEASSSALFVVNITMHVVIHYLFIVFQLQLLNIIEDTSTSTTIPIRTIQWFIFPLMPFQIDTMWSRDAKRGTNHHINIIGSQVHRNKTLFGVNPPFGMSNTNIINEYSKNLWPKTSSALAHNTNKSVKSIWLISVYCIDLIQLKDCIRKNLSNFFKCV